MKDANLPSDAAGGPAEKPRDAAVPSPDGAASPSPRRRRKRYSGTHPKKFGERYKELNPEAYPEAVEHVRSRGRTPAGTHIPVLMREAMNWLQPAPGEVVADCTLGYGGHAGEFLRRIGPGGRLVGFDVDAAELERTRARLAKFGESFHPHHGNFAGIGGVLAEEGLDGFDVVFADLGVSSMQVDNPERGFSYKHPDAPLDMRMDPRIRETAADLLMKLSPEALSKALWELADEPEHERIAEWIANQRQAEAITRTGQLIRLIFAAKGTTEKAWKKQAAYSDLHPAARVFQALRILVNDELGAIRQLLRDAPYCLRAGGRIGIISFHSGEDRLVKRAFREGLEAGAYGAISDDVIRPTPQETRANPRSASAKFRWARKP